MIESYIENERAKERALSEKKARSKRTVVEEFAFYLDRRFGSAQHRLNGVWKIIDITENDAKKYYKHLKYHETAARQTERKIQILNQFMEFAVQQGWIEKRPWRRLFKPKKGGEGHFRVSEKDRKKLLEYLKLSRPKEFFEMRDRAMLLILLGYRLMKTEVSRINTNDYTGKTACAELVLSPVEGQGRSIKITSEVKRRDRTIKLKSFETEAIDEYLVERRKRKETLDEKALFVGFQRRRIAPGMVKYITGLYLERITVSERSRTKEA